MLAKRKADFEYDEYSDYEIVEEPIIKLVPKKKPKRERVLNRSLRLKCLALVVIYAVLASFTTLRSEAIVTEGYDLIQVRSETGRLEQENERLELEIARMKSPERVRNYAMQELGMVMPKDVYFASQSGN
jgi:cell division protein FtsL